MFADAHRAYAAAGPESRLVRLQLKANLRNLAIIEEHLRGRR